MPINRCLFVRKISLTPNAWIFITFFYKLVGILLILSLTIWIRMNYSLLIVIAIIIWQIISFWSENTFASRSFWVNFWTTTIFVLWDTKITISISIRRLLSLLILNLEIVLLVTNAISLFQRLFLRLNQHRHTIIVL